MYNRTLFLRIWATVVGFLGLPVVLFTGGFSIGLVIVIIGGFFISWPIYFVISYTGNSLVNSLMGLNRPAEKREKFHGEYQKAKNLMVTEKYGQALAVIEEVLEAEPDYGDALLLKAQILQRQGNTLQARKTARHLLRECKDDQINCRWAASLLEELNGFEQQGGVPRPSAGGEQ